jgi:hypothetical protein
MWIVTCSSASALTSTTLSATLGVYPCKGPLLPAVTLHFCYHHPFPLPPSVTPEPRFPLPYKGCGLMQSLGSLVHTIVRGPGVSQGLHRPKCRRPPSPEAPGQFHLNRNDIAWRNVKESLQALLRG